MDWRGSWTRFLAVAWSLSLTAPAYADWPSARHDPQRTGRSSGKSDIVKPAPYWRAYLAGKIDGRGVYLDDLNGDGSLDVLILSGGRLVLVTTAGAPIWTSEPLALLTIDAVVDVNGDGDRDIVANDSSRAIVVNAKTGATEWRQPAGELGTLGAVRVGDFNGDGASEVFVDECGCCASYSTSPGNVYEFSSGFGAAKSLWKPPVHSHCGNNASTLGDWDADGKLDLLVPNNDTLTLVSSSGVTLGTTPKLETTLGNAICEAVDVDGSPGDEAICFHNTVVSGLGGGRFVFAVAYHPGANPPVVLLWRKDLAAADGDAKAAGRLVVDLDGDGQLEVAASGKSSTTWTTEVLDAASGASLAAVPGQVIEGFHATAVGTTLIATRDEKAFSLWQFSRAGTPGVAQIATLPERRAPVGTVDWVRVRASSIATDLPSVDLNGDGKNELFLQTTVKPTSLVAYDLASGTPTQIAGHALPWDVDLVAVVKPLSVAGNVKIGISRNDGYLSLLDPALLAVNSGKDGNEVIPGLRVGGYYTGPGAFVQFGRAPVAAKLAGGDTGDSVLVVDSRDNLVAFDAAAATNVAGPKERWRFANASGAAIATKAGDPAAVGFFQRRFPATDPPTYGLRIVDGAGKGSVDFTLPRPPAWDVLPADVDGDGTQEFVALSLSPSLETTTLVIDSAGKQRWASSLTATYGTQPLAVGDWDGDGRDDVASHIDAARVFRGDDGSLLAQSSPFLGYFMPLLSDVNSDGLAEMTLHGGLFAARTLDHSLATTLWTGPDNQPFQYGAMAVCGGASVLVEGSYGNPARLAMTPTSGGNAGKAMTVVLAGGAAYADEAAATAANATLGQLSDVAVTADLTGSGEPGALVGSKDGHLYAVNPCSGKLVWSYSFGTPTGSPVLADTDGDGKDEVLVSVGDGYLYALRDEKLPAPASVLDTDPLQGISVDVDSIVTTDSLYASWSPVPGADRYEVAVVGGGEYVSTPAWQDVGSVTSATVSGLTLQHGSKYIFGVRAVSKLSGTSPDTGSDGVIVVAQDAGVDPGPEAGPDASDAGDGGIDAGNDAAKPWGDDAYINGRACGCRLGGQAFPSAGAILPFAAAALISLRRRKNSPRREIDG